MRSRKLFMVALACLLFVPAAAMAQSSIAGQVTDNTGGVLPGVTVEASSPVLIGGARVVVTDGTGQYNVTNLLPGTYAVTFTLPGFGTQVRNELVLAAGFAMNIDVALSVGAVEESVTVSGQSPVVDVQQVQRTEVLTREVQEALPTGRSLWSYALLVPGVKVHKPDVGGTSGAQQSVMFGRGLGGQHTTVEVDGLMVNTMIDDGQFQAYLNPMMTAETSFTTSGIGAETSTGGLRINMIPQEGGNQLSGSFFGGGTPSGGWQADNWNQRLGDMNVKEDGGVPHVQRIYDVNASVGGPIIRDRLWFFSSARRNIINSQVLNSTKRDGSPGIDDNSLTSAMTRLTYQMDQRNKLSVMFDKVRKRRFHRHSPGDDWETASDSWTSPHYDTGTAKWTGALSSRMLAEFGFSLTYEDWDPGSQPGLTQPIPDFLRQCLSTPCFPGEGDPAAMAAAAAEQSGPWYSIVNRDDNWLGLEYGNKEWNENNYTHRWTYTGSLSYVTGSHNIKVGALMSKGRNRYSYNGNGNLYQVYTGQPDPNNRILDFVGADHFAAANNLGAGLPPGLTGLADQVVVTNHPAFVVADLNFNSGVYAQDSWTLDRLTLNYGLRVDFADTAVPAVDKPGGRFVPAFNYGRIELPGFGPDFAPRLSAAYDLFGNGKTALKFGYNKYMSNIGGNYPQRYAPALQDTDTRDWFDLHLLPNGSAPSGLNPYGTNGDDIAQDWEIGAPGNANFGLRETDRPDANIQREYNILYTVGVQQELRQGLSLSAEFRRRSYHDTTSGDNLLRNFANFGALPNGSLDPNASAANSFQFLRPAPYVGAVTVFNINPDVRTFVDELDRTRGGEYSNTYYGFELSLNARLPNGGLITGGWTIEDGSSYGGEVNDCADEVARGDNPNSLRFCDGGSFPRPLRSEFKLSGLYPFSAPYVGDFQVGASLIAYPGGAGWRGLGESFYMSRSGFLQSIRHKLTSYVSPFYTAANCVAPCTLGAVIAPASEYPTFGTSTGSVTIPLLPLNSVKFYPYWTQVDLNIQKVFNIGGWRYDARLEAFNLLNRGMELWHTSDTFSPGTSAGVGLDAWYERVDSMLDGRVLRVAVTARF